MKSEHIRMIRAMSNDYELFKANIEARLKMDETNPLVIKAKEKGLRRQQRNLQLINKSN